MHWPWLVSYFVAGVFAGNAVPHTVAGTLGRRFQSPFATPPGKGLSSPTVNVLWGCFNAAVAYVLMAEVGHFQPRQASHFAAFGLGVLAICLLAASHFGKLHGGTLVERP